jgi:hypothetical protein
MFRITCARCAQERPKLASQSPIGLDATDMQDPDDELDGGAKPAAVVEVGK